jgi:hypothetical protein
LSYNPADGDTLDPDGLNANLYSTTPSISLYETANGHIELANFAAGFKVKSYHIQPGETGLGGFAGKLFSSDYYQDAYGQYEEYKPVAGCCITFRQRYDASIAQFFASAFATVWRQPGPPTADRVWSAPPDVQIRMFFNGTAVDESKRRLPKTVFYGTGGISPEVDIYAREQRVTRHFNLHFSKMAGQTLPYDQLVAGVHSFGLGVYVSHNTEGSNTSDANDDKQPYIDGTSDIRPVACYNAMHRVRMYVRNAGWYALR